MSLNIQTTTNIEDAVNFIVLAISSRLKEGKKVLWLVPGGSAISIAVEVSKIINQEPHENLTVTLTDERYGLLGHPDSNWQQLSDKGFVLSQANLIPVLTGDSLEVTTAKFNANLKKEFEKAEYKIGFFGIGPDGHTAGILPDSKAVNSEELACGYETPKFSRITMTPKAILKLDEAVAWVQGEAKWKVIEDLGKDIEIAKQPAQILKKVPLLTIFTDYKKQ